MIEMNKTMLYLVLQSIESIDDELYFSTISEVSLKGAVSNPILPGELERMNPKSI